MCYIKFVIEKRTKGNGFNMKQTGRSRKITILFILLILAAAAFLLYLAFRRPALQRQDYQMISSTAFDTAFLSMYPTDSYHEEDFLYFRAMTLFRASYCIPGKSALDGYMKRIAKSGNTVHTVYLGIRPDRISPKELLAVTSLYPSVTFEAILAYPSAEYWRQLTPEEYESLLRSYHDFLSAAPDLAGVNLYLYASKEWLIANPANYRDLWQLNEDLSKTVMLNSDRDHSYLVTAANAPLLADELALVTEKLRDFPPSHPDLSDSCIVFFGDSVIGNYTDSASIPGVVSGLTGALSYNCGYGGNTAASHSDIPVSLPGIVDAFLRADLSAIPREYQVYQGLSSFLENPPAADKSMCFVINYGLNDYFRGLPVSSQDPFDTATYCGAVRTAVQSLRSAYPQAQIILCTPTFSSRFQDGTELHSDAGGRLSDYADAIISLSEELDTLVLDNYYGLGITHDNQGAYLEDQVHPNADCRYKIGCRLTELIAPQAP